MKALQRINHAIWEMEEEIKRNPADKEAINELLEYFLSSRLYLERKNNVPVHQRSFMMVQDKPAHACMLIHGAGGDPSEMKGLADYLFQQGHTVCAMRLPLESGHGMGKLADYIKASFRKKRDYGDSRRRSTNRNTWSACLSESEIVLETLRQYSPDLTIIGFSFGGLIALNLAQRMEVGRLVLIAPAIFPRHRGNLNFRMMLKLAPTLVKRTDPAKFTIADFIQKTRTWIDSIEVPFMLVQSMDDPVISFRSYDFLKKRSNNKNSEFLLFESGGHLLMDGEKSEEIFAGIGKFIKKA